jgi:uncharacterized protein YcfJ
MNTIVTKMNGHDVTIRINVNNGKIRSVYSHPGTRVKVETDSVLIKDF